MTPTIRMDEARRPQADAEQQSRQPVDLLGWHQGRLNELADEVDRKVRELTLLMDESNRLRAGMRRLRGEEVPAQE